MVLGGIIHRKGFGILTGKVQRLGDASSEQYLVGLLLNVIRRGDLAISIGLAIELVELAK